MAKKKGNSKPRERRERRFEPLATTSPLLVYAIGAIGAVGLGAGTWGQFGSLVRNGGPEPLAAAPYILAAGALLVGVAIWLGTSGEPALRVGDAGVAIEKGGVRRLAWHAIEKISWPDDAVRVVGKDDGGTEVTIVARTKNHPQAAAWIAKEARERVPDVVDLPEDLQLPELSAAAGEVIVLEPIQVVGKHCAESGKVIAYEPDARVCRRCERIYHKSSVPEECTCGASLEALRPAARAG
jgi:hypothetical protein